MDFNEYLQLQHTAFVQYYRCLPTSRVNKGNLDEDGNRVIMPPSALERLSYLEVEYPMQFRVTNPSNARVSHVGVLEFVAEEGFIHVPAWLMARLGLADNDLVLVRQTALPKATSAKFQAHTSDFAAVSNPRALLEYNFFTKYTCLTAGETITVTEGDRRHRLDVVEAQPEAAVLVLETDCEVDFATPPKKPVVAPLAAQAAENNNNEPPVRFTGVAKRLDGKPVLERPTTPAPAAAGKAKYGVRFGGVASGGVGKKGTEEGGDKDGERKEQRFTGKAHSLR